MSDLLRLNSDSASQTAACCRQDGNWNRRRDRSYGIRSKTLWMENSSAKGYLRDDFIEIWRRYVPRSEFDAWLGRDGKPETPAGENDETATGEAA